MASLAFLFAPQSPIPAEADPAWYIDIRRWAMAVDRQWDACYHEVPDALRDRLPTQLPTLIPSGTMVLGLGQAERVVKRNATDWMQARFAELQARGFAGPLPANSATSASQALGIAAAPGLDQLVEYRRMLRPIPAGKLKRGGSIGCIANAASPTEFDVFAHGAPERTTARVLVEAYGGECLMVVTWGGALMVERLASTAAGEMLSVDARWRVRLVPLIAGRRDPRHLDALRALFEGSALRPDFAAIERELAAPRISVAAFFAALGIAGAREIEPPDADAVWRHFDAVAASLLAGHAADRPALAAVNALLAEGGEKLPAKPARPGRGDTARRLANAYATLAERMPLPQSGIWAARQGIAQTVGLLDACRGWRQVTFGDGAKGLGPSAATARMLAHAEPRQHAGDPMALALLALECEALNWHGFVAPLSALAETRAQVGFTALVAPASERAALDAAFGLEVDTRIESPADAWTGEVFLESAALVKTDARAAAVAWMRKRRTRGAVVRVTPEGEVEVVYFMDGAEVPAAADAGLPPPDLDALRRAHAAFDVRAVPLALGAGDLLAPVDLAPEVDVAPRAAGDAARAAADALLTNAPAPSPVSDWRDVDTGVRREVRRRDDDPGSLLVLRLRVPGADADGLQALRNDLAALPRYGSLWRLGEEELRVDFGYEYDPRLLRLVLGDAPAGTELALVHGQASVRHWVLAPR